MMTLEDAIKHCEQVAEAQEKNCKHAGHDHYTKLEASACAAEHRQLTEWLKELKRRREQDAPDTKMTDEESINKQEVLTNMRALCDGCYLMEHCGQCNPNCLLRKAMDVVEKIKTFEIAGTVTNCHDLMDDTISKRAAIDVVRKCPVKEVTPAYMLIDKAEAMTELIQLPAAQQETAKRIVGKSRNGMTLWYQCDMCNEPVDAQDNFCRGCGRRLIDE